MKYLHFGPGAGWAKPNNEWSTVDIDPKRGDIAIDFNQFSKFNIPTNSIEGIYASHTFEHVSMFVIDGLWEECSRILKNGFPMRVIVPDVVRSMKEYIAANGDFSLFKYRKKDNPKWTLFECLKADFISQSGQPDLLGAKGLAHQNAWDFKTMREQLLRVGFSNVTRSDFQKSSFSCFNFEGFLRI